ncbi:MAG: hypothetical protein ACXVCY_07320 [Pseudobdellovibrionaceae bacterium]
MKKYILLLSFGVLYSNISHSAILEALSSPSQAPATGGLADLLVTTTSLPTVFIMDSGETISIAEKLPELEAELKAGPENYYYLRALAKQLAADNKKYNGDNEKALADIIAQVKAMAQEQP